uniref:B30.2/SPRY domain-containing protein n=1 Tax=Astyanax mexicanus TaxID=7994 RepID=A0A8B9LUQ0_ASTMX
MVVLTLFILILMCNIGAGVYCVLHRKGSNTENELENPPTKDTSHQSECNENQVENTEFNSNEPQTPAEWQQMKRFKVKITIDPEETPKFFRITHGGKMVNCTQPKENHEEYSSKIFTLCEERFSSGQQYWELKVKESYNQKLSWFVGVATEEAERIHRIPLIPQNGFWVLCYEEGNSVYIRESSVKPTPLSHISADLRTVGVFLDCDNQTLSFYNAETQSHIYTFTSVSFRTSLRPLISPGIRDKIPVHICWINNPILASGSRKTK